MTGGFYTNGKHITDFDLTLVSRDAPAPEDVEVIETVPWRSGVIDFSLMMGEPIKENRSLKYNLVGVERNQIRKLMTKTTLTNWLMDGRIREIHDDGEPGYYYLGKCVDVKLKNDDGVGKVEYEIEFDCYPYKISRYVEGNDVWDTFNFELDIAQSTSFTVEGEKEVTLYNNGAIGLSPQVNASATFTIIKEGISYTISSGVSKSDLFRLEKGINNFKIIGTGSISFFYYKELI